MIVDQENIRLLKSNSLFKGLSESQIKPLLKPKNFIKAAEGEIIYQTDDETLKLYLIVEGEVKLKCKEKKQIDYKYIFDFFGETEINNKTCRISSAVANTNCILYEISAEELNQLISLNEQIKKNFLNVTSTDSKLILNKPEDDLPVIELNDNVEKMDTFQIKEVLDEEEKIELSDEELENLIDMQKSKRELINALKKANQTNSSINESEEDNFNEPQDWNFDSV